MAPVRNGRTAGSTGPQHEDRPGRHQRDRHEVVDGADQDPQPVDGGVARLAAVPVEVDDEGEEDRGRDQAEADDVEVALLERRQALLPGWPGPRARAASSSGAGLGLGRRRAGGISGRTPFDAGAAGPCLLTPG